MLKKYPTQRATVNPSFQSLLFSFLISLTFINCFGCKTTVKPKDPEAGVGSVTPGGGPTNDDRKNDVQENLPTDEMIEAAKNKNLDCLADVLTKVKDKEEMSYENGYAKAVYQAVDLGRPDILALLLEKTDKTFGRCPDGSNIKDQIDQNKTALDLAVEKNDEGLVKLLLDQGPCVGFSLTETDKPLHQAVKAENSKIVALLLAHQDGDSQLTKKNEQGNTPLHLAVEKGNVAITKQLIEKDSSQAMKKNKADKTPLEIATESNNQAIIDLLKNSGNESLDYSLLVQAVRDNNFDQVKNLLQKGVKPEHAGVDLENSALYIAAVNRYVNIVDFLLQSQAKLDVKDIWGNNIWDHVGLNKIENQDIIKLLLQYKAHQQGREDLKNGYLFNRVYEKDLVIAGLLLQAGFNPNVEKGAYTPLSLAVFQDDKDMADLLLNNKAEPNLTVDMQQSPLHSALYKGNVAIAKLLIAKGAALNGNQILTELYYKSVREGKKEVFVLLTQIKDLPQAPHKAIDKLLSDAVSFAQKDMVQLVLDKGGDPAYVIDSSMPHYTILSYAESQSNTAKTQEERDKYAAIKQLLKTYKKTP